MSESAEETDVDLQSKIYDAYCEAIESEDLASVKEVYQSYGPSSLALAAMAAYYPSVAIMKYVVDELGEDPFYADGAPLRSACHHGHMEIIQYLVEEKGADWRQKNELAFRNAADSGHIDVMQYFLKKGADTEKLDAHLQEWSYQRGDDAPNYYWMKSRHPEAYQWYQDYKETRVKNHHRSKQSATRNWARNRKRHTPGC